MGKCPQIRIMELEEENAKLLEALQRVTESLEVNTLMRQKALCDSTLLRESAPAPI